MYMCCNRRGNPVIVQLTDIVGLAVVSLTDQASCMPFPLLFSLSFESCVILVCVYCTKAYDLCMGQ